MKFVYVDKVESLYNGKSLESIKSITLSESEVEAETTAIDKEHWYSITLQVFIPFMIAGIGTIGAGIVLGNVEVSKMTFDENEILDVRDTSRTLSFI